MVSTKRTIVAFLQDLPCHDTENFSLFNTENGIRTSLRRPTVYLPTEEKAPEQVIVTEKKSILLRYLHQQWEKKNPVKKRESTGNQNANQNSTNGETVDGVPVRKRARLETANQ